MQDFVRKVARGGGDGLNVRAIFKGFQWALTCRERCDAAVPLGRELAARWDLAPRGLPAWCRAGIDTAHTLNVKNGEEVFLAWLRQLEAAGTAAAGGALAVDKAATSKAAFAGPAAALGGAAAGGGTPADGGAAPSGGAAAPQTSS